MAVIVREKVKGSGEWWVFINHNGKRRSKKIGTKKAANAVKREVEERLAKGELGMLRDKCPKVAEYGKEWLMAPYHEWRDSTRREYEVAFNLHVKPALGNKRLDEIRRATIKTLLAQLKGKGLSPARLRTINGVISGILNSAIEDELITSNPCLRMGKYVGRGNVKDIDPLTADEVSTLLENASEHLSDWLYTLFLVLVRAGLRIGEALALEWSDIDFDGRTAEITKSWCYTRKTLGPPKNDKARRVDLTPMVVEALRNLRRASKVVSLDGLIFIDEQGQRPNYWTLYGPLRKVEPRPVNIHSLRHSYATLRVGKGDNIVDVSNQLGHHDAGFTLRVYAHWLPQEHKSQVDELDEVAPIRTLTAP
jgi:integrase